MPKVENPNYIKLELESGTAKLSQPEYELSPDEWHRRRTDAFKQLREAGGIPKEILDLVEHFEERKLVQLFVYRPSKKVELHIRAKVLPTVEPTDKTQRLAEMIAVGKQFLHEQHNDALTASEALAFFLRTSLRELKHAEKLRKAAPVRALKLLPRSLIAEIAMDLLASCETWGYPPGHSLNNLIRELLNLEHDRQGMSRDVETKERTARILAQAPTVRTRELARALHVNASTISRWRKSPEFKRMIEREAETLKELESADEKLAAFVKEGPIQKETIALLLETVAQLYGPERRNVGKAKRSGRGV